MLSNTALLFSLLSATVSMAHMMMTDPAPLGGKNLPGIITGDNNMNMPLLSAGTPPDEKALAGPYPCKGHHADGSSPLTPQKTVAAGSPFTFTIAGTATHGGGSCQSVISTDMGKTWSVIQSHIGGCVAEGLSETITIPKDTPDGDVLFGWNWFNQVGNREMYQNCAVIKITGGGSGLSDKKKYPAPFVANVLETKCKTVEGAAVVFPEPGEQVVYGGTYKGTTPAPGGGIDAATCGGGGGAAPAPPAGPAPAPPAGPAAASPSVAAPGAPAPSPEVPAPGAPSPVGPGSPAPTPSAPAPGAPSPAVALGVPASSAAVSAPGAPSTAVAPGSPAPSPEVPAPAPHAKKCERKRSTTYPNHAKIERRHERLVRVRDTGRVAALPAEHIAH